MYTYWTQPKLWRKKFLVLPWSDLHSTRKRRGSLLFHAKRISHRFLAHVHIRILGDIYGRPWWSIVYVLARSAHGAWRWPGKPVGVGDPYLSTWTNGISPHILNPTHECQSGRDYNSTELHREATTFHFDVEFETWWAYLWSVVKVG